MLTFDNVTVENLRHKGAVNWSTNPEKLGAFVAEMDFGTAPEVVQALRDATDRGMFGYLPDVLSEKLSIATSGWYTTQYGWTVPAERIHPVADVLTALRLTLEHYSAPGSRIIVPTPTYMKFLSVAKSMGRDVIEIPLIWNNERDEIDLEALDRAFHDGGGILLLCNPFNPLGRVFTQEELVDISDVVARNGGRVFADEVHAPLVYDGSRHVPYASVSEAAASHTITGTSAAKAWNLAGLKCAQIILSNDADAELWTTVGSEASHGASTLGVIANTAAYNDGAPWRDQVLNYLDTNRRVLGEHLSALIPEIGYQPPDGTYVAWLDCRALKLGPNPAEFFREKAGVALTDGARCGEVGRGFVRLIFATPRPILEREVEQMARAVQAR